MKKILTLLIFVQTLAGQTPATPAAGNAEKGKATFMKIGCYTCHGTMGQGGAGARLAPNPLAAPAFINYVRKGGPNHSFLGGMPAYSSSIISDADLADIRAYLASIPAPPEVKSIPLLNQ
jgi:mono/diheme cytochrome c family protein